MILEMCYVGFGLLAGTLHFSLLQWNTVLYERPHRIGLGAVLQAVRIAALACLLVAAARHGALPLLLMTIGVLVARPIVMRWTAVAR